MTHASRELIERYVTGDPELPSDVVWGLEAHLERCAGCRSLMSTKDLLIDRVHTTLMAEVAKGRPARRRTRWLARWATPALVPWLGMTVLAVVIALGMDLAARGVGTLPSLVLLLAPIMPLLGVAAAWAQGRDTAYEVVAATPKAGLALVFRRTLAVLVVTVPALSLAGLVVGASPVRWLLPCLAFTVATLALGTVVGVPRAAIGLALTWAAFIVAPSLATARTPAALEPVSLPWWAAVTAVVAIVLVLRRAALTRLASGRA